MAKFNRYFHDYNVFTDICAKYEGWRLPDGTLPYSVFVYENEIICDGQSYVDRRYDHVYHYQRDNTLPPALVEIVKWCETQTPWYSM